MSVANVEAIPLELKTQRRWVPWRYEDRLDARTGELKKTKVPYQIDGRKARSNDARTWTTFGAVYAAVSGGEWDGIGFQLDGSDYTAWDLDKCRDPQTGAIEPWAADIVRDQDSYTEVTPSGTGLRILVRGKLPPGRRRRGHLEVYDELRFVTLTGHHLQDTPATIEDREERLHALHARLFPVHQRSATSEPRKPVHPNDLADRQLLEKMFGAQNGARVAALWQGKTGGYESASEADLSLANYLVWWTGRDGARADRLFRRSGLFRDKWDRAYGDGSTYGSRTINTAIDDCDSCFREDDRFRKVDVGLTLRVRVV